MAIAKHISERDLPSLAASDFWDNVSKRGQDDCWPWIGPLTDKGYGRFFLGDEEYRAHRVAFAIGKNTAVPGVVMVCHRCDNRPCANPNHLFIGLALDNNQDARDKGRAHTPRGTRNGNGKISDEQVAEIMTSAETGAALARRLKVSPALVSMIRSGQRRQMVGGTGIEPVTSTV